MSFSSSSNYRKIYGDPSGSSTLISGGGSSSSSFSAFSGGFGSYSNVSTSKRPARDAGFSVSSGENVQLSQTFAVNDEYKLIRTNEKQQLQGLNDRFAVFIKKVHDLEQENVMLRSKQAALLHTHSESFGQKRTYQQEMQELRAQVEKLSAHNAQVVLERSNLAEDLQALKLKYQEEIRRREGIELSLKAYRKDVDHATLVRLDLEKRVESLRAEIAFFRKMHEDEVTQLMAMLQASGVAVETDSCQADLTVALREIRAQYEALAAKNLQVAQRWHSAAYEKLVKEAAQSAELIRAFEEKVKEYRKQMEFSTTRIESLEGMKVSLERQIVEMEERHTSEAGGLQIIITQLETDLMSTKNEMTRLLREHHDLLNIKMALDLEITAYRNLLDSEETHFSNGGISMSTSMSALNLNASSLLTTVFDSSSPILSKKEKKKESLKRVSKISTQKEETFEKHSEGTLVSTKKVDKAEHEQIDGDMTDFEQLGRLTLEGELKPLEKLTVEAE
uniref:Alpha-internexin-like n=1 Tax=Geotrypetes seraphini TaxID=260995 RepID=A0A6P8QHC2_GEOSA|nr:alpha-internexin-like [Geotrypetes seraphini]